MIFGIIDNQKVKAKPELKNAICPGCKNRLVPACGDKNVWHFRHRTSKRCDSWHEPITEWHINWQQLWSDEQREVFMTKNGNTHIADVVNEKGTVIEFQNSPISIKDIQAREKFYGKMIWVFNGAIMRDKFTFSFKHDVELQQSGKFRILGFNNSYPRKYLYSCKMPVFIDFGTNYLYWLNFYLKEMPVFRQTNSYEDSREFAGDSYSVWESETSYFFYPIKAIHKNEFLKHYAGGAFCFPSNRHKPILEEQM